MQLTHTEDTLKNLEKQLSDLRLAAAKLEAVGAVSALDYWLDSTGNGKTEKVYYRKRWFDSDGNKQSEPLTKEVYRQLKQKKEAGKELARLEKQIRAVEAEMNRRVALLQSWGVSAKAHRNQYGDSDASVEWYTPSEFINLARSVLGQIDLDPASNPFAQAWIQATNYYTQEDDGLVQPWNGRVWCNPPYGKFAQLFLRRGLDLYQSGEIEACIFLVNRSGAAWYMDLIDCFDAVCLVRRRIAFLNQLGEQEGSPRHYNDFLYLGPNVEGFKQVFSAIGKIYLGEGAISKS